MHSCTCNQRCSPPPTSLAAMATPAQKTADRATNDRLRDCRSTPVCHVWMIDLVDVIEVQVGECWCATAGRTGHTLGTRDSITVRRVHRSRLQTVQHCRAMGCHSSSGLKLRHSRVTSSTESLPFVFCSLRHSTSARMGCCGQNISRVAPSSPAEGHIKNHRIPSHYYSGRESP